MNIEIVTTPKGEVARWRREGEARIARAADFLELMGECPTETIVLEREDLDEGFYDLSSGVAGDILQKVSNYRRRLAILGDFAGFGSAALRDFIYESNRTGQVVFAPDLQAAVALLR